MRFVFLAVLVLFPLVSWAETFQVKGYEVWATAVQRGSQLVCEGRLTGAGSTCRKHRVIIQTVSSKGDKVGFEVKEIGSIDGAGESRVFKARPYSVGSPHRSWDVEWVNVFCESR